MSFQAIPSRLVMSNRVSAGLAAAATDLGPWLDLDIVKGSPDIEPSCM